MAQQYRPGRLATLPQPPPDEAEQEDGIGGGTVATKRSVRRPPSSRAARPARRASPVTANCVGKPEQSTISPRASHCRRAIIAIQRWYTRRREPGEPHPRRARADCRRRGSHPQRTAELVRAWGYAAEEAGDGLEALERITEFRPTIIVSDMIMPRMNGLELLKAIREDMDNITVILLTAQGTVDTAVEA
jgi:hypothetical protein